jgi:hypothetical protein
MQISSSDILDIFILVYKTTIGFSLLISFHQSNFTIISNEKSYYLFEYDCKHGFFAEKSNWLLLE